jgi:hypothetical protein
VQTEKGHVRMLRVNAGRMSRWLLHAPGQTGIAAGPVTRARLSLVQGNSVRGALFTYSFNSAVPQLATW